MRTHWSVGTLVVAFVLSAVCAAIAAEGPPAVEVHGWSLTRYYVDLVVDDTRDGSTGAITNKEEDSRLEWERFSISGLARLDGGKVVYSEVYIHPWLPNSDPSFLYLESLYLDVPVGPGAKVRLGKGRSNAFGIVPSYGNRKTSNYGPLAETFTMDRALGVQFLQTRGKDSLNLGLFESQRPGTRAIGMAADMQLDEGSLARTTVSHLANRDTPAGRSGKLEVSGRYGRQMGALNVGISGRGGELDDIDAAFLASKFANYNGTNRTRLYAGFDATYQKMPYYATAEWYGGSLGGIDQSGYAILVGVEPSAKCTGIWQDLSGACKGLFIRYTNLDTDTTPSLASSITWDTEQWAVSYVLPIKTKYFPLAKWIQIEYERNKETVPAGGDEIPNNVFFVELFSAF
ncbi:MAG: hypothetical protein ACE149_13440 [Armatimonadota bacterium]